MPSTPKGTRDFLPDVVRKRNYIFGTIRQVFEKYGYQPIETPAMENLETLTGKYGEEGDRLIFKILQRDQKLQKALRAALNDGEQYDGKLPEKDLADIALRYDLTVPFARFVVQHQNELSFPFRRYQIQPVWRADRPQKGRYREFFQCDADVVGTDSLRCEVEYCQIFDEVFTKLDLPVEIRLNNRKLLAALAEYIGEKDRLVQMTIAIDKLDKMPLEKVLEDLRCQEFPEDSLEKLKSFLEVTAKDFSNGELLDEVSRLLGESEEGIKGVEELRFILEKVESLGLDSAKVVLDLSLARGLNYYTGAIFEVRPLTENQVGSICGGGRYDDLTGIFGMKGMSGVGISFGADRIYDLLEAEGKFPEKETEGTKLLFVNFGETEADYCHEQLVKIRNAGIRAELYPDSAKMKKQMKYANDKQIPYVALVGENEMEGGTLTVKEMTSGEQLNMNVDELIKKLS
ncbi:MAG: histidine--tRNA ligase [Flavobacteriales bacterium]|nr:histidine--tRNA ligase [Flavobacteriales bacterium]